MIVDDGSTDKTGKIIDEVEKKRYEWIKGIHLEEHEEYIRAILLSQCSLLGALH